MNSIAPGDHALAMSRLLAWIDGIDLPMFVLRHTGRDRMEFVHANAALGRVAGVRTDILPGRSADEIFPARMAERLNSNYLEALHGPEAVSYEECLRIDGRDTWWQTTISKPAGFDGQVVLGVAVAITDHKTREFAAADAMAELVARFDDLRLFSTMAAHDARSPLATVSSLIDLVLEDFNDMGDGKRELLRLVSSTVDEALAQIAATLQRARGLSNVVDPRCEVDLGRLCADIAAMVDPEMRMRIDVPALRVEVDEVVVQMGIRNLMSNAARYCSGRIAVRASEDRDSERLLLEVADDGPGLPEGVGLDDLMRRGEDRAGSHGFGLRSIAQLVRSRGGGFEIAPPLTAEGLPGARFRLSLPGRILQDRQARKDAVIARTG